MSTQPDGTHDAMTKDFNALMGIALRVGETLARQRAETKQQQLLAERQRRRELEERFEAERSVMRADLARVNHDQFWDTARPTDVADQYATAIEWSSHDEVASDAREKIETEVEKRYGMTVEEYTTPPARSADAERAQAEQADAERDHTEAARLAGGVMEGNARNEQETDTAIQEAAEMWDSGDRRAALADALMQQFGDTPEGRDGVAARILAETDQGTPPSAAAQAPGKSPRARKDRGNSAQQDRSRSI